MTLLTEADYSRALARVEALMETEPCTTEEEEEMEVLVVAVEAYERAEWPDRDIHAPPEEGL